MGKPQFQWLLMAAEFRQFGGILWFLATAFEARKQDPKHVTVLLKEIEICRFSVDQQTEKSQTDRKLENEISHSKWCLCVF
jgi:hypothetical protein